jgi:hypothetical protein
MKNRFVHYKIHSIELCGGFKVIISVVQMREYITRNTTVPTSVWGDAK